MAESPVFEWVSLELEKRTALSRLEARGTLRLVLREIGLAPASVSVKQMQVVAQRVLAPALEKRRVAAAGALCAALSDELAALSSLDAPSSADAYSVFERMVASTPDEKKPR
ncbi:MAG: hypothetical protein IT376_14695 [Polyangiaceae bacterium]|nr:hypothetical protein [Polyangiaceae bacterium]